MRRSSALQIVLLLLLPVLPAALTGWLHPRSPWRAGAAGAEVAATHLSDDEVTLEIAQTWGDAVLWVDARPADAFAREHIPGAVSLTEDDWDAGLFGVLERVGPETRMVVYCSSLACGTSREVADRLRHDSGLEQVYVLSGGWEAWKASRP